MPTKESSNKSDRIIPTHNDVRPFIPEALDKHEQSRLRRLVDDRRKIIILAHFGETHERAKESVYTPKGEVR